MRKEKGNAALIIILIIVITAIALSGFLFVRSVLKIGNVAEKFANEIISNKNNETNNTNDYDNRIEEILDDYKEIEKKWLIDKTKIPYDLDGKDVYVYDIQQTYLCFDPEVRVRNYNNGGDYEFTIKSNLTKDGLIRDETNFEINAEQYNNLMENKKGNTIHKTRYQFLDDGEVIAIDIFHDDLDGLAYMEIEFANKEEAKKYKTPDWVIKDVTDNVNYKNGHLARFGIPQE